MVTMNIEKIQKIGEHWSRVSREAKKIGELRLRWWQSPFIIRHINNKVCGEAVDGFSQGLINRTKKLLGDSLPFERGISVGCGNGTKEINLIRQNVVSSFDLFEFSEQRIADGIKLAESFGLEANVRFMREDAFKIINEPEQYDMVHWNNSLHHMFDVFKSVEWSKKKAHPGL